MATEYIQNSYYEDDKNKFIDIHQSIKVAVEDFLVTLLFKGDFSRIIYCTDDICFRRRIELVDSSHKDMENIQPINLNLPFANFCQTSDFDDDDRVYSVQTGQAVQGQYIESMGQYLRSIAVKSSYKATVFFSRRDDVRLAHQLTYWEKTPKAPIWIHNTVSWNGNKIDIPCNITINSVDSHIDYKESDWLEKSRIFPMTIDMTVRSYEILIPNIQKIINLPIRFGNKYAPETYDSEDQTIYLTQEAILIWANKKYNFNTDKTQIRLNSPDVTNIAKKYFSDKKYTEDELIEMCGSIPNYETNDIIQGYWTEQPDIAVNQLSVVSDTSTSLVITCKLKPADFQYFDHMKFFIPGHGEISSTDPRQTTYKVTDLYPNSIYNIKLVIYGKAGNINTLTLQGTTIDDSKNEAPTAAKTFKNGNSLIGMEF